MAADLAARITFTPLPRSWMAPSSEILVAASVVAILAIALILHTVALLPTTMVAAYPMPGASDVSTDTAVRVTFPRPVDRRLFQDSIRLDPPVPVGIVWDSPKEVDVVPLTPLSPDTTYTLIEEESIATPSGDATAGSRTLTVFRTAKQSPDLGGPTPVVPRSGKLAQALVVATVTSRSSSSASSGAATGTCAIVPQRGFELIYAGRPEVRSGLGCPQASERAVVTHTQVFQHGVLIAIPPNGALYYLSADATWQALALTSNDGPAASGGHGTWTIGPTFSRYWTDHPDAQVSLGAPTGPEQSSAGATEQFDQGMMLWTPGWIFVLRDDGHWQRFVDVWALAAGSAPTAAAATVASPTPDTTPSGSSFGRLRLAPVTPLLTPIVAGLPPAPMATPGVQAHPPDVAPLLFASWSGGTLPATVGGVGAAVNADPSPRPISRPSRGPEPIACGSQIRQLNQLWSLIEPREVMTGCLADPGSN